MKIITSILICILFTNYLEAQILECKVKNNMDKHLNLVNNNFKSLKSSNGIIYTKKDTTDKYNSYVANTKLGIEGFVISKKPILDENGIAIYSGFAQIIFKNGKKWTDYMFCYDAKEMNKLRKKQGLPQNEILVNDQ